MGGGGGGGWVVGNNEFGLHMPIFFTRVVNINNSAHPLLPYSFGQASILFWKCATSWKIAKSNLLQFTAGKNRHYQ